jgi:hypothetical protein
MELRNSGIATIVRLILVLLIELYEVLVWLCLPLWQLANVVM